MHDKGWLHHNHRCWQRRSPSDPVPASAARGTTPWCALASPSRCGGAIRPGSAPHARAVRRPAPPMNWARLPCMQPHSGAPGWRASLKNIPPPDRAACIAAWYSHAGPEPSRLFGVTTWMPAAPGPMSAHACRGARTAAPRRHMQAPPLAPDATDALLSFLAGQGGNAQRRSLLDRPACGRVLQQGMGMQTLSSFG